MEGVLTFNPVMGVNIVGFGSAHPDNAISNIEFFDRFPDIAEQYGNDPSEIARRTGVENRYWAEEQSITDLMQEASLQALKDAGVESPYNEVKAIIAGTWTPDKQTPEVAELLQKRLGIKKGYTDTDSHACASFASALIKGYQLYDTTNINGLTVVTGGDILSRRTDIHDPKTAHLLGDAAGAVVITPSDEDLGLLSAIAVTESSNGSTDFIDMLHCDTDQQELGDGKVKMKGQDVFKYVTKNLPGLIEELLKNADVGKDEVIYISHQANQRIIDMLQAKLDVPPENMASSIAKFANTSAGSIPTTLREEYEKGHLDGNKTVAVFGFGAGMTIAAALVRVAYSRRNNPRVA